VDTLQLWALKPVGYNSQLPPVTYMGCVVVPFPHSRFLRGLAPPLDQKHYVNTYQHPKLCQQDIHADVTAKFPHFSFQVRLLSSKELCRSFFDRAYVWVRLDHRQTWTHFPAPSPRLFRVFPLSLRPPPSPYLNSLHNPHARRHPTHNLPCTSNPTWCLLPRPCFLLAIANLI